MRAPLRTLLLRSSSNSKSSATRLTLSNITSPLTPAYVRASAYFSMPSTSPQPPAPPPPTPAPSFSSNTDPSASLPRLIQLLRKRETEDMDTKSADAVSQCSKHEPHALDWTLTADAKGLKREFKFKTFKSAWAFMNTVAEKCAEEKHHPEWTNLYNKVTITWTTHRPSGLSYKDLTMAEFCDEQAQVHGEVVPPLQQKEASSGPSGASQ